MPPPRPRRIEECEDVSGSERLLVVEDEPLVRRVAEATLSELGYAVLEARSGVEALELFENDERGVDLLVTDLVMPQMSGRELARRLRKRKPDLPVLFVSGYTEGRIPVRLKADGARIGDFVDAEIIAARPLSIEGVAVGGAR